MDSRPAILSISSMKTIPECSTRRFASPTTLSISTSLAASSWARISIASGTLTVFFFVRLGRRLENISLRLDSISSIPWGVRTSTMGVAARVISTSTDRSLSFPSRSNFLSFPRVPAAPPSSPAAPGGLLVGAVGNRISRILSSANSLALISTCCFSSSLTMLTASSMRSRMMDSTSLPT